jgi:hypothetical protein
MKLEKTDRPFDGIDLEIKLLRNEGLSITSKEGMGRVAVAVHDCGAEQLLFARNLRSCGLLMISMSCC